MEVSILVMANYTSMNAQLCRVIEKPDNYDESMTLYISKSVLLLLFYFFLVDPVKKVTLASSDLKKSVGKRSLFYNLHITCFCIM